MEIEVVTRSKQRAQFLETVAQFYAQELKITNSKFRLTIYTVKDLAKTDHMRGVIGLIAPGHLSMAIDSKMSTEQTMRTLAHEMVHAKQWAKGQIKQYKQKNGKLKLTWLNRQYSCSYYDQPWEIEAYSRESILLNKILRLFHSDK